MNKEFDTTYTGVYSVPNYYFNNGATNIYKYIYALREIKILALKEESLSISQEILKIIGDLV